MCLFSICIFPSVKCLFLSFVHILIGSLWLFLLLNFKNYWYFLEKSPLLGMWFANVFSQSVVCLHLFYSLVHGSKVLILMKFSLCSFSFAFPVMSENSWFALVLEVFLPTETHDVFWWTESFIISKFPLCLWIFSLKSTLYDINI